MSKPHSAAEVLFAERYAHLRGVVVDRVVGANLRRLRQARGLDLASLAYAVRLPEVMVEAIEAGTARMFRFESERAIACLEADLDDLFADPAAQVPA